MTLILSGRNYKTDRDSVTVFGHTEARTYGDESPMIELQPMVADIVGQFIGFGDKIGSLKLKISPQVAGMLLASGQLLCHRHLTRAFEGDDYIEVKDYFDVDERSVSLWIVRDMPTDIELWNGQDQMVENFPMFNLC